MPRDFPLPEPQKPQGPIILKCVRLCCGCAGEDDARQAFDRDFIGRPACVEALAEDYNATVRGPIRYERNQSYRKP